MRSVLGLGWGNPEGKNLPGDSTDNPGTNAISVGVLWDNIFVV